MGRSFRGLALTCSAGVCVYGVIIIEPFFYSTSLYEKLIPSQGWHQGMQELLVVNWRDIIVLVSKRKGQENVVRLELLHTYQNVHAGHQRLTESLLTHEEVLASLRKTTRGQMKERCPH